MTNDRPTLRVDLGCGDRKPPGFVGVDIAPGPDVDIVCDLNDRFPFETGTVDYLRAHDLVQQLPDRIRTMNEIWRVCRDGATVDIRVPSTDGRGAFQDPSHVSFWNANSFFYYSDQHPAHLALGRRYGFTGAFRITASKEYAEPDRVVHLHVQLQAVKPALSSTGTDAADRHAPSASPPSAAPPTDRLALARRIVAAGTACDLDTLFDDGLVARYKALAIAPATAPQLTPDESAYADWLEKQIAEGLTTPRDIACQLALFLFRYAYTTPPVFAVPLVPAAALPLYIAALHRYPSFFLTTDDLTRYTRYQSLALSHLDDGLATSTGKDSWVAAGTAFAEHGNLMACYFTTENLRRLARIRASIIERTLAHLGAKLDHAPGPRRPGPLRVGFFLAGLEPTPELFSLLPLLKAKRRGFEFNLYLVEDCSSRFALEEIGTVANVLQLPPVLPRMVQRIRAADLDVAYFATNLTFSRSSVAPLAAHRLARVQISSVASVCTSGFRAVDAYLSCASLETDRFPQAQYTEELVKIEPTAHCFAYPAATLPGDTFADRPPVPVAAGETVFTSGASMFKITPEVLDTWVDLLADTTDTRLVLFPFGRTWTTAYPKAEFAQHIAAKLHARRIDLARVRLIDTPSCNRIGIRNLMAPFHVYLDTFPFSGSTSMIEPLENALPIVTMTGPTMRAAMAASMLKSIGLDELITATRRDYLDLAIRLAREPAYRADLSARIADAMAAGPPFLDAAGYADAVFAAFRRLATRSPAASPVGADAGGHRG